jgi:hypothetical protein
MIGKTVPSVPKSRAPVGETRAFRWQIPDLDARELPGRDKPAPALDPKPPATPVAPPPQPAFTRQDEVPALAEQPTRGMEVLDRVLARQPVGGLPRWQNRIWFAAVITTALGCLVLAVGLIEDREVITEPHMVRNTPSFVHVETGAPEAASPREENPPTRVSANMLPTENEPEGESPIRSVGFERLSSDRPGKAAWLEGAIEGDEQETP